MVYNNLDLIAREVALALREQTIGNKYFTTIEGDYTKKVLTIENLTLTAIYRSIGSSLYEIDLVIEAAVAKPANSRPIFFLKCPITDDIDINRADSLIAQKNLYKSILDVFNANFKPIPKTEMSEILYKP